MPGSTVLSRRDLDFLLYDWLGVDELPKRERFAEHSRETFDAILDLAAQIAEEQFAPHNKCNDTDEPRVVDGKVRLNPEVATAVAAVAEAGLLTATIDAEAGGLQLPHSVNTAVFAWLQAANIATSAYSFLSVANANLLLTYGTPEQIATYVQPMLEGRFFGTMCLSEPAAGSSLADITTKAEPQSDGTYRITGNKMWISAGDHELGENIVHLVLARIPGAPRGVKGISLFIVPKHLVELDEDGTVRVGEPNDVALAGLNHKMGYRGTSNALLNFGEGGQTPGGRPGAVGYLVGAENQGLACMFHMMNEARVGVGAGAAALAYTGYLKALDYAKLRLQGRPPGGKDPAAPQVPLIAHADVKRMLLAQKAYAEGSLALVLYAGRLLDEIATAADQAGSDRAALLLDVLTPVVKSWPAQWGLAANDLAIQVHGGYGYTREYDVEQHYRDNRLNAIHEGTHGIQAVDLLGRKVTLSGGAGLRVLVETIAETVATARSRGGEAAELGDTLDRSVARLVEVTGIVHGSGAAPAPRLANATAYLEAAGHIVVAWVWLQQYLAADGQESAFHRGKQQTCRYFFRQELPRTGPQLDLVAGLDATTLEMDAEWF